MTCLRVRVRETRETACMMYDRGLFSFFISFAPTLTENKKKEKRRVTLLAN